MNVLDDKAKKLLDRYMREVEISDLCLKQAIIEDKHKSRKKSRCSWQSEAEAARKLAEYLASQAKGDPK